MNEHWRRFEVWLLTAHGLPTTLRQAGVVRSAEARLLLPHAPDVCINVRLSDRADQLYFGGMTIHDTIAEMDWSTVPHLTRLLEGSGLSPTDALRLTQNPAAWLSIHCTRRASATAAVPQLVQRLLVAHEGIAFDEFKSWTSSAVRQGRTEGIEVWPYPTVEEEFLHSDVVFIAKPARSPWLHPAHGGATSVHVLEVLRGTLPPTVDVHLDTSLVYGARYVLFATYANAQLRVDWRGNSGSLPEASEVLAEAHRIANAATRP